MGSNAKAYQRGQRSVIPRTAFSHSRHKPVCVDCGADGEKILAYALYEIGDIVCNYHAQKRWDDMDGLARISYRGPVPKRIRLIEGVGLDEGVITADWGREYIS